MRMMYISHLCSASRFRSIKGWLKKDMVIAQAQKYNRLIIAGLLQKNIQISSISTISTHYRFTKRLFWRGGSDEDYGVRFYYVLQVFIPVIRIIVSFIGVFARVILWTIRNRNADKVIICDILNIYYLIPAVIAAKLTSTKIIGSVTDLPKHLVGATVNVSVYKKIVRTTFISVSDYFASKCDGYIVLTMDINSYVNRRNVPFSLIEGVADRAIQSKSNLDVDKYPEKVVLFAGTLDEKYGIKKLTDAFMLVKNKAARLHLYGAGDALEYIIECMLRDDRIYFGGLLPNDEIVDRETKATILANPRPTKDEYTRYSFPSKIIEYMASGTPVLTTRLSGIPIEYYDYCYFIDDETVKGLADTLELLLSKPDAELREFGKKGKEFILTNKSSVIQAEKISELIERICGASI